MKKLANELIDFISNCKTSFHTVNYIERILKDNGFKKLIEEDKWDKEKGKYYVKKNNSSIIAFNRGDRDTMRIIASHTDSPSFVVKSNSIIRDNLGYVKLNTEGYGGMIISTWFDRPLSIAGRVVLKGDNPFNPKEVLFDSEREIVIIPSLAIHLNKKVNEGIQYNLSKDTLPLLTIDGDECKEDYILKLISDKNNVAIDDILDYDLFLYNPEKGKIMGLNEEFISCPRLDDLMMVFTSLKAFIESDNTENTNVLVCLDSEEIGSTSPQGAKSRFLQNTLIRIIDENSEKFIENLNSSFMISADVAHSVHPNYPETNDLTNKCRLGDGIVIKKNASMKYSTNAYSAGVFIDLCNRANIPFQRFTNRSDISGGSTIGPVFSSNLSINVIDVGPAILSMHSARELSSVKDNYYSYQIFKEFYK